DPGPAYVGNYTHGVLRSDSDAITFYKHLTRVETAILTADGAIGATFRIDGLAISTLSVWRDEASLEAFVTGSVHSAAETANRPGLQAGFLAQHWTQLGSTLPITF